MSDVIMQFGASNPNIFSTDFMALFYYHDLSLILEWMSYNTHHKVWDEITYPFPNFNGATDVWTWVNNLIPCFTEFMITYTCWDWS